MTTYINLTPHNITKLSGTHHLDPKTRHSVADEPYTVEMELPSSGCARVAQTEVELDADTIQLQFGEVQGLPEPQEDTIYIVSPLVLNAAKALGRSDCRSPAHLLYDESTHAVLGCYKWSA